MKLKLLDLKFLIKSELRDCLANVVGKKELEVELKKKEIAKKIDKIKDLLFNHLFKKKLYKLSIELNRYTSILEEIETESLYYYDIINNIFNYEGHAVRMSTRNLTHIDCDMFNFKPSVKILDAFSEIFGVETIKETLKVRNQISFFDIIFKIRVFEIEALNKKKEEKLTLSMINHKYKIKALI